MPGKKENPKLTGDYLKEAVMDAVRRLYNTVKGKIEETLPEPQCGADVSKLLSFANSMVDRLNNAIELAFRFGQNPEVEHKAWVVDQMVRALLGCPCVKRRGRDAQGNVYFYHLYGESPEYNTLIAQHKKGEDGPETFKWDTGVAP